MADTIHAQDLVPLSGPSPFAPDGCGQVDAAVVPFEFGTESDIALVVDPKDQRHLVAGWIQDNAVGVMIAISHDRGASWSRSVASGFSLCANGAEARYYHTRLAFGPDGLLYLSVQSTNGAFPDPRNITDARVPVAVSRDGGTKFGAVSYMDSATDPVPQFDSLAAEPDASGAAVVVWHDSEPATLLLGATYLSRTTDGGNTWSRHLVNTGQVDTVPWNRVVALPDGTLLVAALDATVRGASGLPAPPVVVKVRRSLDKGLTWSAPLAVAGNVEAAWASAAVGPDGAAYLGWRGFAADGSRWLYITKSLDGGVTWSEPVAVTQPVGPLPGLAVSGDGSVGFNYTDDRNASSDHPDTRDVWFAYSRDGGGSWNEIHLAGPFDLASDSSFFHDSVGLADGFGTVFLQGAPNALDGGTDVFFSRVVLP